MIKFWDTHEQKIVLIISMILLAIISFEAGILQGKKWQEDPLIINAGCDNFQNISKNAKEKIAVGEKEIKGIVDNKNDTNQIVGECRYVGSKKSNKYHRPDCRYAKKIKPENKICFTDKTDAQNKGYIPASCLAKD